MARAATTGRDIFCGGNTESGKELRGKWTADARTRFSDRKKERKKRIKKEKKREGKKKKKKRKETEIEREQK